MTEKIRRTENIENRIDKRQIASDDIMNLYLSEVGHIPLLSAEEEVALAACLRRGQEAEERLGENDQLSPQERERLKEEVARGEKARDQLVKANSRLVMSIARRYVGQGVPLPDLIQEGTLGLIKAIDRFDHRLGYKLSTYATWWIRQALIRAVPSQGRNIRLPVHRYGKLGGLRKASVKLEQQLGREPTSEELAEEMDMAEGKMAELLKSAKRTVSLDTPVGEEGDSFLLQFIEDEEALSPEDVAAHSLLQDRIERLLSDITPREERVIRLRFGFEDGHSYTLWEIGEKIGLTRERIRQIVGEVLRQLRHLARARQLREL